MKEVSLPNHFILPPFQDKLETFGYSWGILLPWYLNICCDPAFSSSFLKTWGPVYQQYSFFAEKYTAVFGAFGLFSRVLDISSHLLILLLHFIKWSECTRFLRQNSRSLTKMSCSGSSITQNSDDRLQATSSAWNSIKPGLTGEKGARVELMHVCLNYLPNLWAGKSNSNYQELEIWRL